MADEIDRVRASPATAQGPHESRVSGRTERARRASRRSACIGCGYSRRGLGRVTACPECGVVPPPRGTLLLSEESTISLLSGGLYLLIGVLTIVGLPSLVRGELVTAAATLTVAAMLGVYQWHTHRGGDDVASAMRVHWSITPAGIVVWENRNARFIAWSDTERITIHRSRRGLIKVWLTSALASTHKLESSLHVRETKSLTSARLSRCLRAMRLRGLRRQHLAPPPEPQAPSGVRLDDAAAICHHCGQPVRLGVAPVVCPRCGTTLFDAHQHLLVGQSSPHPLVAEFAGSVLLPAGLALSTAAALAVAGRLELALAAPVVTAAVVIQCVAGLWSRARRGTTNHAWVLREDGIDVFGGALVRRVPLSGVTAVAVRDVSGGRRALRLLGHETNVAVDMIVFEPGPHTERTERAVRAAIESTSTVASRA